MAQYTCVFVVVAVLFLTDVRGLTLVRGPSASLPPSCKSNIYCKGVLLEDVQLARLYSDSKTFVDFKLRYSEDVITEKYKELRDKYGGAPPFNVLQQFVNDNFEEGTELEQWTPTDFTDKPSLVDRVADPLYKDWVISLNNIFRNLSRRVKDEVYQRPDLYSLLWVPNGFVIPGGRFRELYYWDTYWIINGLLLCDMKKTARGIIENFIYIVKTNGFIPNGSRKYYLQRSQPPLFITMAHSYYEKTGDIDFIKDNIDVFEQEYMFWEKHRMIKVRKNGICYKLARYYSQSYGPRPESYREDYITAEKFKTEEEKNEMYIKIKSAAESGHDFSTRWFIKDGTNKGNLSDIDTPSIIPVDLNAFLHANAVILSNFNGLLKRYRQQEMYKRKAENLLAGITAILWREDKGMWFDYDIKNKMSREYFYLTNLSPLWTISYPRLRQQQISEKVLDYIKETGIEQFIGGIPTSLENSGEQWDFPNAWPPLQAIAVEGLLKLDTPQSRDKAFLFADRWVKSNYRGYKKFGNMFEKYDVLLPGQTGAGGEYEAQKGFGWTNGVILQFLDEFGKDLKWGSTMETVGNI